MGTNRKAYPRSFNDGKGQLILSRVPVESAWQGRLPFSGFRRAVSAILEWECSVSPWKMLPHEGKPQAARDGG